MVFRDDVCNHFECRWAEARIKIARMTLTIKLDGNWSSFQLANSAPPLSVTDSAIAPSARIAHIGVIDYIVKLKHEQCCLVRADGQDTPAGVPTGQKHGRPSK